MVVITVAQFEMLMYQSSGKVLMNKGGGCGKKISAAEGSCSQ